MHHFKHIRIPETVQFAHLDLRELPGYRVDYEFGVLLKIAAENELSPLYFEDDEVCILFMVEWYEKHRADGGEKNAAMEDMLLPLLGRA